MLQLNNNAMFFKGDLLLLINVILFVSKIVCNRKNEDRYKKMFVKD